MINELGITVSLDMDMRSKGALSGRERSFAMERPKSEPLFAMLSVRVLKKVGVNIVWRKVAQSAARLRPYVGADRLIKSNGPNGGQGRLHLSGCRFAVSKTTDVQRERSSDDRKQVVVVVVITTFSMVYSRRIHRLI